MKTVEITHKESWWYSFGKCGADLNDDDFILAAGKALKRELDAKKLEDFDQIKFDCAIDAFTFRVFHEKWGYQDTSGKTRWFRQPTGKEPEICPESELKQLMNFRDKAYSD